MLEVFDQDPLSRTASGAAPFQSSDSDPLSRLLEADALSTTR
jgi:hypothetical protein